MLYFSPPVTITALPTTPVSVQYTPSNFPSNVKTLATGAAAAANSAAASASAAATQAIVQNLQQNAHSQQIVQNKLGHQAVAFNPTGLRNITTASLPTVPNPQTAPPINVVTTISAVSGGPPSGITGGPPTRGGGGSGGGSAPSTNNTQFQRLKVEDALSYLDQVKYKFDKQPKVRSSSIKS